MYCEYDYDAMFETSRQLNAILNNGISQESIRQFVNCGFALNWKGPAAERFRSDLHRITSLKEFNTSALDELRFIANYPQTCAEHMIATDKEVAAKIHAIFED